jgi:D-3-phosphoglycerate dehydrogenase / 2-oxoglutarate reductase
MIKILANDGISEAGKQKLESAGFEVMTNKVAQEQLISFINEKQVDVLLVRSATRVTADIVGQCESLKLVGRGGVGLDNVDQKACQSKGIKVVNTPAASSESVAELVFAHLFGLVRSLHDSNRQMPLEGDTKFNDLKKAYGKGIELRGKVMGIVGFGRIGQATAKIALGVGMEVKFYDPFVEEASMQLRFYDGQNVFFRINRSSLEEVLKSSDFISLHVPKQTNGEALIARDQIEMMKDGVIIVNTARGGLIHEDDLLYALDNGKIRAAALDVFENEPTPDLRVLMNPHLSLSPHIGAATEEAQERIGLELAELISDHFAAAKH